MGLELGGYFNNYIDISSYSLSRYGINTVSLVIDIHAKVKVHVSFQRKDLA